MKIKIRQGKKVISLESDDAGVPDTTVDAGADVLELNDSAQLPGSDANAEFDAADSDTFSAVEDDDSTEHADGRANEAVNALFNQIFGVESAGSQMISTPNPNMAAEDDGVGDEAGAEAGAGEVTERPGVTEVDLGNGTVITIDSTGDETAGNEAAEATPEEPGEGPSDPAQSADAGAETSLESFWANLDLKSL